MHVEPFFHSYIQNKRMSLSNKGVLTNDKKLSATGKATTLNPNAAEFVPFALRSSSGSTRNEDVSPRSEAGTPGKAVVDRSYSSVSNNSDEEAHHYWRRQLPDDITPDFKYMGDDEFQGGNGISFSSLSLHDGNETSRFSATSAGSGFRLNEQQDLSIKRINGNSFAETIGYSVSSHEKDPSSSTFVHLSPKPWDDKFVNNDQLLTNVMEGHPNKGNSTASFLHNMLNEQSVSESVDMNPLDFLASQFPGFAAESLTEVYFANGGDLNLTIEMLTQLEMHIRI